MNANIPQGRGMIKWAPFATMPEQFENVYKLQENNTHVPAPNLTDELQQDLELKLRKLVGQNVLLRYWQAGHENVPSQIWMTGARRLLRLKRVV